MPTIGLIIFDGFQVMALAALSCFEMANKVLGRQAYEIAVVSEHGGQVRNSLGFTIDTSSFAHRRFDTMLATGTLTPDQFSPGLLDYVRDAAETSRRMAGICTGTFVLAAAGLLDGRRATTHWAHAQNLQRLHPSVRVEPDRIFTVDGKIWTSAGMSAGIDLALALVEEDFGQEVARSVARRLVVYLRRPGGQSQFSPLIELEPRSDRVRRALTFAKGHLRNELSVDELAEVASLSPRQFSRVFREETGQSPAKAVERLRLEAARLMMEDGRHSLDEVARETGFAERERMRRAFLRCFGQPPQALRRVADRHPVMA